MAKTWLPLEANPDVLTAYANRLGLSDQFGFHDVLSVEDWALDMIPAPVRVILLLFPISEASEQERREKQTTNDEGVYFMRQTVENACGTIAVLHALVNLASSGTCVFEPSSFVGRMLSQTSGLSYEGRGAWLEADAEIESAHIDSETLGQSQVHEPGEVDTHFIAFIHARGRIFELDGRRYGPILRGDCANETEFPQKVLEVIKTEFMDRNPGDIRFSILALAPTNG